LVIVTTLLMGYCAAGFSRHELEQMIAVDFLLLNRPSTLPSRSATRLAIVVSAWSAAIVGSRILIVIVESPA